jgi:HAMP domain-containing protein
MSIRTKLILAISAGMLVLAAATGVLLRATGDRSIRVASEQAIASAAQAYAAMERAHVEKLDTALRALSTNTALVEAFERRDRAKLSALVSPVFEELKENHDVTHLYFIEPDPSRKVFLRGHRPELHGDRVERATLRRAMDTLAFGAGAELGLTAFALRVVRPWYGRNGDLAGFAELGEEMDHFLARMKAQTGDEFALIVEKEFLDEKTWASMRSGRRNDWNDRPRTVVVNATMAADEVGNLEGDASSIPDRGLFLAQEERGGKTFVRGMVPVKDAAGRRVGGLVVLHDISDMHAAMHAARRGLYIAIAAVTAAFALVLVLLVDAFVLRRLDRLRRSMDDLAGRLNAGDRDLAAPRATGRDEMGRTEDALGRLVQAFVAGSRQPGGEKRVS